MPSSVRAHTTATSAIEPLVIHILVPDSTQSSPSRRARRAHRAGVRAGVGFGQAEAADRLAASPCSGSHRCFCSSLPYAWIAYIAREPCTLTSERSPESTASISAQTSPYCDAVAPWQP